MNYTYPSIAKFQQLVELKDYRPATKKEYLRYGCRTALGPRRILRDEAGRITFKHKDSGSGQWRTLTRRTGRNDCNRDAPAGLDAHG
jgi:hypothetical protein